MNITVFFTPTFNRKYKKYQKKYPSIDVDLKMFIDNLDNALRSNLGGGIYKYRLSVRSKNRGKSGGFRVITYEILVSENEKEITLISIYNKNEISSISKVRINAILKEEGLL